MKMSSDIIDVEVNVVSSPERSRSGSVDVDRHSPPTPHSIAVGEHVEKSVGGSNNHSSSQINTSTSVNISVHHNHPQPLHSHPSYPPPQAGHQLSNHHHSSNSAESNHSTSLSSSKPTKSEQKKMTTTPGYTSFSISSILSRSEPKKDAIFPSLPMLPLHHSSEDLHNSAMFSRYEDSFW